MLEIDGSKGGGQMLRTSLCLSAITGKAFRMENIRGSRPNPGLKRQHLEAVEAVSRLCEADVEGNSDGSDRIEFRPGDLEPENFTVNIGTAGSVTLLLDTLLPLTTQFDREFRVAVKGGTDVKWSPTAAYLRKVKLPLLRKFGMDAELEVERTGFYPAGGGEVELRTGEFSMDSLEFEKRGRLERFEVYSKASVDLEDQGVADRQALELARRLKNSMVSTEVQKNVDYVKTDSTGSSLTLAAAYENSIAGFDSLGERGKRSEDVAIEVYDSFRSFHSSGAAVDGHMADQLLVFLALAGGKITVPEVTDHLQTNIGVIRRFGLELEIEREKDSVAIADPDY